MTYCSVRRLRFATHVSAALIATVGGLAASGIAFAQGPPPPADGGAAREVDAPVPDAAEAPAALDGTSTSDAGEVLPDASERAEVHDAASLAVSLNVTRLHETATRIRDLIADRLGLAFEPRDLFDVELDDEEAIALEAKRLAALIAAIDVPAPPIEADAGPVDDNATARADAVDGAVADEADGDAADATGEAGPDVAVDAAATDIEGGPPPADGDASTVDDDGALGERAHDGGPDIVATAIDPALWEARVELDRARVAFYVLPVERRAELLAAHAERQRKDSEAITQKQLDEAARKSEKAAEEQRTALEAARNATSDAERLVAEEQARLLGVARAQADFETALVLARQKLREHDERTLFWLGRVRDVVEAEEGRTPDAAVVDRIYLELRQFLRGSRDELDQAITARRAPVSTVPDPGPDRLQALPAAVDTSIVRESRAKVEAETATLREADRVHRQAAVETLIADVISLNKGRLSLLPFLSSEMRDDITGFGAAGRDQAATELRQAKMVVQFRWLELSQWFDGLGSSGSERSQAAIAAGLLLLRWSLPFIAFIWWRRNGPRVLEAWVARVSEHDLMTHTVRKSWLQRWLVLGLHVQKPAAALLFVLGLRWMMPDALESKLEFRIATTILEWFLGSMLIVAVIDGFSGQENQRQLRQTRLATAHIRLRSLRLIGRVVAVFGLMLSLSAHFAGHGTLYSWVFSTCWFAAIPVGLLIVRWWRDVIFENFMRRRKKDAFSGWVAAHDTGLLSLPAATLGGAFLMGHGIQRRVRHLAGRFELARRAFAYLFRRGLDKLAEDKASLHFESLSSDVYDDMGPEGPSQTRIMSVADEQVTDIIAHIRMPGGGVYAVVGARGAGKSATVERIRAEAPDVLVVSCPFGGYEALTEVFRQVAGAEPGTSLEELLPRLAHVVAVDSGIIIDDAHRLIQPVMGGMRDFDRVMSLIRLHSHTCAWVATFDDTIWRFLERSRGARPLFDEVVRMRPWREEAIAQLLAQRAAAQGLEPTFKHLVDDRGKELDELDREVAEAEVAANYYRLLWDYSGGNPGVALHVWRNCLGLDADGDVCAKLFEAPDTNDLERLPETTVSVLRAVMQFERPRADDIERATQIGIAEVENALRYGVTRGYFVVRDERYEVTWTWLRAIRLFLQRRHLLAPSGS